MGTIFLKVNIMKYITFRVFDDNKWDYLYYSSQRYILQNPVFIGISVNEKKSIILSKQKSRKKLKLRI